MLFCMHAEPIDEQTAHASRDLLKTELAACALEQKQRRSDGRIDGISGEGDIEIHCLPLFHRSRQQGAEVRVEGALKRTLKVNGIALRPLDNHEKWG